MDPNAGMGGGMVPDQFLSMLMLTKMSSGNSTLDMMLVMMVPVLLRQLWPLLQQIYEKLFKRPDKDASTHERSITYTQKHSQYSYTGDIDKEPPNHLLQAALLLYLNHTADIASKIQAAEVQLRRVKKDPSLTAGDKKAGAAAWAARGGGGNDDDGGGGGGGDDAPAGSGDSWTSWCRPSGDELLDHLGVSLVPPAEAWVELEPGLKLQRLESNSTGGGGDGSGTPGGGGDGGGGAKAGTSSSTTTLLLRGKTAAQVDGFIGRAWAHFREERRKKKKDESRYLYMPVLGRGGGGGGGDDDAGGSRWTYKRYKLSDEKTFASLFHPEKAALLDLLDAFSNGRGKFAIPGYPQKLGFLLHGPPGTGKTSFIKALAGHTGRSIVSIPLSRIRTNQELFDMLLDQVVNIEGQDMPVALPFSKVIFIFEDVDACGDVVEKRGPKGAPAPSATATTTEVTLTHRELARRRRRGGGGGGGGSLRKALLSAGGGGNGGGADLVVDIAPAGASGSDAEGGDGGAPRDQAAGNGSADGAAAGAGAGSGDSSGSAFLAAATPVEAEILPATTGGGSGSDGSAAGSPRVEDAIRFVTRQESLQLPPAAAAAAAAAAGLGDAFASWDASDAAAGGAPHASHHGLPAAAAAAAAAAAGGRPIGPVGPGGVANWLKGKGGGDDALNLAGILNVLDGVVDTPGRIVVLTSNHPEKLDPALIRPGRINKKVYMGNLAAPEARQMLHHWFGPGALAPGGPEAARFERVWADGAVSPASLEAMCAEHDDVSGLLDALEAHPPLAAARAARRGAR